MKLTKKQEAEVTKVYDTWLNSYLNGDVKTYDSYLDKDYHFIGSTDNEDFLTRKETTKFFKTTAEQLAGKCQIKNNIRIIEKFDELVFITERFDANFLIEKKWVYYGKFRFSSVMHKKAEGWRFIYQHFSMPDSKAQDGETLGAEQVSKENQELRDAIKRRTAELEIKNRELEIATALERVRAVAMAMHKQEDLTAIGKTIFTELKTLGFAGIRNTEMVINNDEKETVKSYHYSDYGKQEIIEIDYKENHIVKKWAKDLKKAKNAFVPVSIPQKEMKSWNKYRKELGYKTDPKMARAKTVHYYSYSIGLGALSISCWEKLADDQIKILERFRNVFNLAYQRYTDIAKAEAQAREAQIETALERVRSRSLAMHNTSELQEVIHTVHEELLNLNIAINGGSFIAINSDIETTLRCWGSGGTADTTEEIHIPLYKKPFCTNLINRIKKGPGFFTEAFTQKEKKDFFTFLFNHEPWKKLKAKEKKETLSSPGGYTRSCFVSKHTSIFIINHFGETFSAANNDILQRFGKVFEQSYTRFLDLQKAEAQTKEARIETALERVRAVAMAMKKSDEVINVCEVMYKELQSLGFTNIRNAQIALKNDSRQSYTISVYSDNESVIFGEAHYHSSPIVKDLYQELEQSKDAFYQREFSGKKFNDWRKWREGLSPFADSRETSAASMCFYLYSIGIGHIGISTFNAITEIQIEMLKRFKNVFELCYTRYIDVAKAEAQTREAQINLAVERVRARALAMFKSEEILEVVFKLKQEIMNLEIPGVAAATIHLKEKNGMYRMWDLSSLEQDGKSMHLPLDISYNLEASNPGLYIRKVWENTEAYFLVKQDRNDLKITTNWLRENNKVKEADEADQFLDSIDFSFLYHPTIQLNSGRMSIDLLDKVPQAEMESILTKMGAAFDLAYKRFEDLKKSEEQLREAEVDLALERVRSQAMAMQKSSDLLDIVVTMRNEFTRLGHEAHYFWHMMWLPEKYEKAMTSGDGTKIGFVMELPRHIHGDIPLLAKWEKSKKPTVVYAMNVEEALDYVDKMVSLGDFTNIDPQAPSDDDIRHIGGLTFVMARTTHGEIGFSLPGVVENPPKEDLDILVRFAGAFDIAHRRFLDLQKSEAQSREVEIELALEKVRSRSMGMQKSEELKEVIQVVYDEFVQLKINVEHTGFIIDYKANDDMHIWLADRHKVPAEVTLPYFDCAHWNSFVDAKKNGKDFFANHLSFEEKNKFYTDLFELIPGVPEETLEYYFSCAGLAISTVLIDNVGLYIENFSGTPYTEEENKILMRFGKVFQQTYTRFLDLQKAEAQAREAQIQLALERVRARTMAMQHSNELSETATLLFKQIVDLGIQAWSSGFNIWHENDGYFLGYNTGPDGKIGDPLPLPFTEDVFFKTIYDAKKSGEYFLVFESSGESLAQTYRYMDTLPVVGDFMRSIVDSGFELPTYQVTHCGFFPQGHLMFITLEPHPEAWDIFKRFTKEFQQTYTRFIDLQKAEASAREAKIEAALERTRTQSMIMQHSNELDDALRVFHEQILFLGIDSAFSYLWLPDEEKNQHIFWAAWAENSIDEDANSRDSKVFKSKAINYPLDRTEPSTAQCLIDWKSNVPVHTYHIPSDGVENYFAAWKELLEGVEKLKPEHFTGGLVYVEAFMKYGCFGVLSKKDLTEDEKKILLRFSIEFERTYTRFLDLQKAETSAREAMIEASLERVRSRSMAMHKSNELKEAGELLWNELTKLGIESLSSGYVLMDAEEKIGWIYGPNPATGKIAEPIGVLHKETKEMLAVLSGWEKQDPLCIIEMNEEETIVHQTFIAERSLHSDGTILRWITAEQLIALSPKRLFLHNFNFNEGYLLVVGGTLLTDEQVAIMLRFTKVFQQTYTRFNDLQKAEAQAREAKIEMALEKIRSRTMAMQNSNELPKAANLLFLEVQALGIPAWSAGYNILAEDKKSSHCIMSSEGEMQIPFNLPLTEHSSLLPWYEAIKNDEPFFVYEQGGEELAEHYRYMATLPELEPTLKQFADAGIALPTHQINHLVQFPNGFLLFITYEQVPEAHDIFKRFTKVFEQTYTRFLDLKKAEAHAVKAEQDLIAIKNARQKAEEALSNLQATQTQLVQSEKMASLGELTAGIAHEIQNPLNFVNNFSEVSKELLEEMNDELEKGNLEDVRDIMKDVIQNLEKINHHGKRADGIVKGMLQHSRSSSGTKEPTDINALADEYLRLAYHGLRAKDKSFNATMKTDFDSSLEKVNVIPQDIGRVILNLITNAFYVVDEKKKSGVENYEPTVTVSSKKVNDKVEISVTDNGNGIPQKVLDKIFQPFFTTKPTGKGTGLGLSLAFDIVTKGHGGELKVETKEGEGTEFIILLPV